ncbi:MAG: GNAT family N-acetyltransferase [Pseudomonadota bacterium]
MSVVPHIPRLTTKRLIMRGHVAKDLDDSAAMWADPAVVALISGTPSTRTETWARLLTYAGLWQHLGYGYWAVTDRVTGAFLGEVGFADFKRDITPSTADSPEIGWAFRTDAQGRGLAVEAVTAALAWADQSLRDNATLCIINPLNDRSLRLASKVGYADAIVGRLGDAEVQILRRMGREAHGAA